MELKDVILSTLAEMEDNNLTDKENELPVVKRSVTFVEPQKQNSVVLDDNSSTDNELVYLKSIKERLLVLFEGFQAPNNSNIEAKLDMTLNFLEYTLATIDERVYKLEKGNL